VAAQNKEGGWRYEPRAPFADVSVTVAIMMALRAARNAGVFVPKATVDRAVQYIKACQQRDGGFCYIKGQGFAGSAFARSAAAVVGLFCAGVYEGKPVERGLAYLMRFLPGRGRANVSESRGEHYFYGHYYAALAMWTAGGNYWVEWFPAVRDELIAKSRTGQGGVWTDWHGAAYATAMSCIVLQLPNNYLPIMQK
jgi:Squalene-hopene cyclase C-terminal domain